MTVLDIFNTVVAGSIPVLIVIFGHRLENRQKEDEEAKEQVRSKIERRHDVHVQFELEGEIFGPQAGYYLVELTMVFHNKGLVRSILKDAPPESSRN